MLVCSQGNCHYRCDCCNSNGNDFKSYSDALENNTLYCKNCKVCICLCRIKYENICPKCNEEIELYKFRNKKCKKYNRCVNCDFRTEDIMMECKNCDNYICGCVVDTTGMQNEDKYRKDNKTIYCKNCINLQKKIEYEIGWNIV